MSQLLAPLSTFTLDGADPDAFEALYDRYAGVVFSLALRIVRDRELAEEILEEVFFRAWQRTRDAQTIRGSVFAWLMEMTRAMAIEAAYVRRPSGEVDAADQIDPESVDPDPSVREFHQAVGAVLTGFSPGQRRALELAYFEGLTEGEIAKSLGVEAATVRAWLGNAMHAIRASIRDEM